MYNKKTLSKATAELDKAKAPAKPKDIITDPMGQWKYPGLPTRIPGNDITMKGVGYPVLGVANNGQRKIMLPGADYTFPGAQYVDEYPQMKKGGTKKKRKTKSIMGINKLMQKGTLFEDYSKRMYDPNVDYFQKGGPQNTSGPRNIQPSYDYDDQQFHQNDPAGYDEFINGPGHAPDTYKFPNHPTFSKESMYSNEETPGGEWMENPNGSWKFKASSTNRKNMSKEEMQDYFNQVEPGNELEYKDGGIYMDLTNDEIEEYRKGGYIVEDISVPELNQAQKGGNTSVHVDKNGTKTTKYRDSSNTVHYKVETKDGKVYHKQDKSLSVGKAANDTRTPEQRAAEMNEFYKSHPGIGQSYLKPGTAAYIEAHDGPMQSVDDFWTLPIGMSSAGVRGTIGLAKGLGSLASNTLKSSLVQSGKAGTKALLNKSLVKSLPGSSINNLVASGFAGTALTDIVTGKFAEPWKKANKSGKVSDYADAVAENMFTALDAIPLYKPVGKGLKQLGKIVKDNSALSSKYLKALPGKKVVKATEDLKQAENKLEEIRRAYHNNERALLPEESVLLQKNGVGERLNYFDPVIGKKADAVLNKMIAVNKNPVLKTDPEYMQALVDKTQRLRRADSGNHGIGVQEYIDASPNFKSANQGLRKLENKFGNNWFEKPYTRDAVLNEYVSNPRFGPYNDSRFARYLSDSNIDIQRRLVNGQNITEADQNLLNAMRNRSDKTTELFNLYGHAQVNDPSRWQTALNENSNLRRTLQNENLFSSPEFAALPDNYRNQIIDFRNSNQQFLNNMFTHRGSIDLRRNVSHAQNSYTEPQQAFDDAIKELYNTEEAGKHAKKIEESLIKLNGNRIVPGSIPYHGVDKVPQYTIEDPSLLSSNDLNEIDEKIDFVTKALKNPNLKNPKLKKSLETQLEDLHSNKWLRTGYHETMKEAGFKIPKEYEDMSMITQDNTKYLFDSKGNLIGNISGVSKEYPFIGSTGLMPHLHGTNPIGKESQMGKTLYRSIHHGLNNAHGVPLQSKGNFQSTELLENGLPVQRKRAANMWNSGVAKGWFEDTGSGTYKVIKRAGGVVTQLTPKEIQEYINQGYIVEDADDLELNQAQKGKSVSNKTSTKFSIYTAKNDKDYAFRKKAYDDSLALHKHNLEYDKLALKGNHMLTSKTGSYDPIAYKNLVNKMQYNDALQEKVIKNSKVPHERVISRKVRPGVLHGDFINEHPRPKQMIMRPLEDTSGDIIHPPAPNKGTKKVAPTVPVNVYKDTLASKTEPVKQSKYPKGYQPYSLYGKVLDPEVYGYGESLNGRPVQVAQFGDTYGYKEKMDAYRKSGKYPWVKQKGGAKDKYATHIGDDGTVGSTNVHTDKNGTITTKVQDSKGITHYKVKTKDGKVFYKQDASTTYPKNNSVVPENYKPDPRQIEMNDGALQSVDDVWTLPIGMTSTGVKGAIGLAKGLTSLGRNAAKSSLAQATKQGFNQSLIKSLPGSNLKNLVTSHFAASGINNYIDQNSDVRRATKKAYDDPTFDNVGEALGENTWNALNFSGLNVGKGVKQLGKYATTQTPLKNTYKVLPEGTFKNYSKLKTKGNSYRVAGHDAHKDFVESGVLRSKTNLPENATFLDRVQARPTAFPSFQKDYADLRYLPENGGVVFETEIPTFKRGELNPVTGGKIKGRHYAHRAIDPKTGRTLTEIPASDIDVYEGSANWLKGHKKISGQQPQASASKNKMPGLKRVANFVNGLNYGIDDIIKGRKFSETFPITKKQKAKIEYLQDQAHKGGLEFMDDYLYRIYDGVPHYGEIHPDVRSKIDKVLDLEDPTLNTFKRKFDNTHNLIGPYGNAQHRLVNSNEKQLAEALANGTLDDRTVDYIRKYKHKISGVNWHPQSVTFRNRGLYYEKPERIRNVTVHEAGHSMQELGYGSRTIGNNLSRTDPKYKYSIPNENTKVGKEFRDAQVFPEENKYLWEGSPLEVHSEAMAAKDKIYREFVKKGMNKMDALRYLRNPDNTLADEIIKEGSLNRFFKDGITNDQKRKLIKILPAVIPVGAAVNYMPKPQKSKQMKKGGIVADLTHEEIQDYIKQGYIVEDVD